MSTRTTYYSESYGRVPIIALDYNQRYLRRCKELMIDYNNGILYYVDPNDRDTIINLSNQIASKVKDQIDAEEIIVNIEGVGEINLSEFVTYLENQMLYVEAPEPQTNVPLCSFDTRSIEVLDDIVQLTNFKSAVDGYIPYKNEGILDWMQISFGTNTEPEEPPSEESADGSTTDITLSGWGTFISSDLSGDVNVTINTDTLKTNYGKIIWNVAVTTDIPRIVFPTNVKFTFNTDPQLFENCIATFKLETFTGGSIWLCTVEKYLDLPEKEITEAYIVDKLSWKFIGQ